LVSVGTLVSGWGAVGVFVEDVSIETVLKMKNLGVLRLPLAFFFCFNLFVFFFLFFSSSLSIINRLLYYIILISFYIEMNKVGDFLYWVCKFAGLVPLNGKKRQTQLNSIGFHRK